MDLKMTFRKTQNHYTGYGTWHPRTETSGRAGTRRRMVDVDRTPTKSDEGPLAEWGHSAHIGRAAHPTRAHRQRRRAITGAHSNHPRAPRTNARRSAGATRARCTATHSEASRARWRPGGMTPIPGEKKRNYRVAGGGYTTGAKAIDAQGRLWWWWDPRDGLKVLAFNAARGRRVERMDVVRWCPPQRRRARDTSGRSVFGRVGPISGKNGQNGAGAETHRNTGKPRPDIG